MAGIDSAKKPGASLAAGCLSNRCITNVIPYRSTPIQCIWY
jgi:hypothetical protein